MTERKVRNFAARAQAILSAHDWPESVTATLDGNRVWLEHRLDGTRGPVYARVSVFVDPYDLTSVDPKRIKDRAVLGLRAQAASPTYTNDARAHAALMADTLAD